MPDKGAFSAYQVIGPEMPRMLTGRSGEWKQARAISATYPEIIRRGRVLRRTRTTSEAPVWDYREGEEEKEMGMRIELMLAAALYNIWGCVFCSCKIETAICV